MSFKRFCGVCGNEWICESKLVEADVGEISPFCRNGPPHRSFPSRSNFNDEPVQHQPMVESSGDEGLVGLEGGFHDVLEAGELEILRVVCGEEDGEDVDTRAVFFLRQPGAVGFGEAVEAAGKGAVIAGGDLEPLDDELGHEQVSHHADDGGAHDADGGFVGLELLVDELDGAGGVA